MPIASCHVTGHHREKPDSFSIASHQIFIHVDMPLSLFSSRLNSPRSPKLSLFGRSIELVSFWWTGPNTPVWPLPEYRRITSLALLTMLLLIHSRKLLAFITMKDATLIVRSPVSCCLAMLTFWIFQKQLLTGGLQLHWASSMVSLSCLHFAYTLPFILLLNALPLFLFLGIVFSSFCHFYKVIKYNFCSKAFS